MKLSKNQRLLVLVTIILGGGLGIFFIGDYAGIWTIAPDDTTSTVKTASTFTLYSNMDGEDVSSWTEMDIWVPKSGADFSDGMEDVTNLNVNFEGTVILTLYSVNLI